MTSTVEDAPDHVLVVDDTTGRKITYDIVTIDFTNTGSTDSECGTTYVENVHPSLDVLLLHGMTPHGRKCWGLKDYGKPKRQARNGTTTADNLSVLKDAIAKAYLDTKGEGVGTILSSVRFILPDRPGYCDSDSPFGNLTVEQFLESADGTDGVTQDLYGAIKRFYSYKRFAEDMSKVLTECTCGLSPTTEKQRNLIVLGTSSGGPYALSIAHHLFCTDTTCEKSVPMPYVDFLGTVLCSVDCPYRHPRISTDIVDADEACLLLEGTTVKDYLLAQCNKKFRRKTRTGFLTDSCLERCDWGFDLAKCWNTKRRNEIPVASSTKKHEFARIHMYVGGEKEMAVIRMAAGFLKELLMEGGDGSDEEEEERVPIDELVQLTVLEQEDHFYASRKPAILGKIIAGMIG